MNDAQSLSKRQIGRARGNAGRYARVVDSLRIHGVPVDFRTLAERVIPPDTRYLVLDLDRTLHLGRNMGELLGFEICARLAYGKGRLDAFADQRGTGRFAVDLADVGGTLRYAAIGARMWAFPGLFYLMWGKLSRLTRLTRRMSFRRFGPEPVRRVQSIPQTNLLHQLAEFPLEDLRELMRSVWRRHQSDQVIEREDIAWLRERCPGICIILTSASPQPVVEVAAEMLGIDEVDYTFVEAASDRFSTPFGPGWVARRAADPQRVAPPSGVRINSSYSKIEGLLSRHPDMLSADVTTVGITDTGYGEDHCWGEYFTHVVDVNSNAPFAPVVSADSPLREVHSAHVLSRGERDKRVAGQPDYLDPRRSPQPSGVDREVTQCELTEALADVLFDVERVAACFEKSTLQVAVARAELARNEEVMKARVEELCAAYNRSEGVLRRLLLAELDAISEQFQRFASRVAEVERPVSEAAFRLTTLLESARERLERVERPRIALA